MMDFLPATPPYEDEEEFMKIQAPPNYIPSRKSTPHRSPSVSMIDKSLVFQLCGDPCLKCKVICGQSSILASLRKRVAHARTLPRLYQLRTRTPSFIQIPNKRRNSSESLISEKKPSLDIPRRSSSSAGRPSKVKGPCQACQEASDGCMRKAFDWPFPTTQVFHDKGKPYVYLCNKCGLRYNKSGGSVCRHCRWVFCKEERRKALRHIDVMRDKYGQVDIDQDIENFSCHPKYWTCNKPWKVGWVLKEEEA